MKNLKRLNSATFVPALQNWYASAAGQILSNEVQNKLEQVLPALFGYYALQIGAMNDQIDLLSSSKIGHKIYMMEDRNCGSVTASSVALPFPADTLDLVVLPHTLDFSTDPHQVLREVHRVLISEGHIIIIAFNPLSMMGLSKLAFLRSKKVPWMGHFYSARRLKDWLKLLDFSVLNIDFVGLQPPLQNSRMQQRMQLLNKIGGVGLGRYRLGRFGGVQIFVAQKRVLTLTPRPQPWLARRPIVPVNVTESSLSNTNHARRSRYLH